MQDVLFRQRWPEDRPPKYDTYWVAMKSLYEESYRMDTLEFMLDPYYERDIYDTDLSKDTYETTDADFKPNPEPQGEGWYSYDAEYGYLDWTSEVVYWWKPPVIEVRHEKEG